MSDVEQRIRERAYFIWIDEGRPDGREKEHWCGAEQMLAQEAAPSLVPQQPVPPTVIEPVALADTVVTKTRKVAAKLKAFAPKRKTKAKDPAQTRVH